MMYSCNVIVGITIFCGWFVFSQSHVSASLTSVQSLAVRAFDRLVNCSLSVVGFVPVFDVGQYVSVVT